MINNIVWIRHAEKLFKNGKPINGGKAHDPGINLTENTEFEISDLCQNLINIFGCPDRIIISPFLRTRQTADIILNYLENYNQCTPKVEFSINIAEYLGFCKTPFAQLENDTLKHFNYSYRMGEKVWQLEKRIDKHISEVSDVDEKIWVVTHGIVISKIYETFHNEEMKRPKPLDYIAYTRDKFYTSNIYD
jgi:broad specificity phosphatase PhoE